MTTPGQEVNGSARTEADHHMKCPACGQWFNMRDLAQAYRDALKGVAVRRRRRAVAAHAETFVRQNVEQLGLGSRL